MTDWIVDSPPSQEILPFSKKALQKNTIEKTWPGGSSVFRHEVTIAYHVLALCQSLYMRGHCSHVCKGFVPLH